MRHNASKRKWGVGVGFGDLTEESRFGQGVRKDIIQAFPGVRWVKQLDREPKTRELYLMDRRRFLWTLGLGAVAPVASAACSAAVAQLIFIAIEVAAKYYLGNSADGSAIFGSSSPSRETFQLLTKLVGGTPDTVGHLRDEMEYQVDVPSGADDYPYFFSGLVSEDTGDHYVQGIARGDKKFSDVFQYEEE